MTVDDVSAVAMRIHEIARTVELHRRELAILLAEARMRTDTVSADGELLADALARLDNERRRIIELLDGAGP